MQSITSSHRGQDFIETVSLWLAGVGGGIAGIGIAREQTVAWLVGAGLFTLGVLVPRIADAFSSKQIRRQASPTAAPVAEQAPLAGDCAEKSDDQSWHRYMEWRVAWQARTRGLDVFDLEDAAAFLRVESEQLRQAAKAGEVGGLLVGEEWRFNPQLLKESLGKSKPFALDASAVRSYNLPEMLSAQEAAQYLRVDTALLLSEVESGRLPALSIGGELRVRSRDINPGYGNLKFIPSEPGESSTEGGGSAVPPPAIETHLPGEQQTEPPLEDLEDGPVGIRWEPDPVDSPIWTRLEDGEALPCTSCEYLAQDDKLLCCAVHPYGPGPGKNSSCPDHKSNIHPTV